MLKMKNKILFIGSSYTINTIVDSLDILLDFSFDNVVFLKENIQLDELYRFKVPFKTIFCDTIDEAMEIIDIVIIVKDSICQQTEKIKKNAIKKNKEIFILDTTKRISECSDNSICDFSTSLIPKVLIISLGQFTQHYKTEMSLNKELRKINIDFYQFFSEYTQTMIEAFYKSGITSHSLTYFNSLEPKQSKLLIQTISTANIDNLFDSTESSYNLKRIIKPDFVILCVNGRFVDVKEIRRLFKYKFGFTIDEIVMSDYVPLKIRNDCFIPLYYNASCINNRNPMIHIYDNTYVRNLLSPLLSKLTLPKGIHIL